LAILRQSQSHSLRWSESGAALSLDSLYFAGHRVCTPISSPVIVPRSTIASTSAVTHTEVFTDKTLGLGTRDWPQPGDVQATASMHEPQPDHVRRATADEPETLPDAARP